MDLGTTQQIILIILASALAIFLILAIVIGVMVIKLLTVLKMIAAKAERVVESAEAAAEIFKKSAGPLGVFSFARKVVQMVNKHGKER